MQILLQPGLLQVNALDLSFQISNHLTNQTMTSASPDLDIELAGLKMPASPKPSLFPKFLPEVRTVVFDEAIEWDGKTPALIVAL